MYSKAYTIVKTHSEEYKWYSGCRIFFNVQFHNNIGKKPLSRVFSLKFEPRANKTPFLNTLMAFKCKRVN